MGWVKDSPAGYHTATTPSTAHDDIEFIGEGAQRRVADVLAHGCCAISRMFLQRVVRIHYVECHTGDPKKKGGEAKVTE